MYTEAPQYSRQQSYNDSKEPDLNSPQPDEPAAVDELPSDQTSVQLEDDVPTAQQFDQEEEQGDEEANENMAEVAAQPAEPPAEAPVADLPSQGDKAAATLSKELRKLQAESAVLQEHSRRLQEKAAFMQQQRMSADQVTLLGSMHELHRCSLSRHPCLCWISTWQMSAKQAEAMSSRCLVYALAYAAR